MSMHSSKVKGDASDEAVEKKKSAGNEHLPVLLEGNEHLPVLLDGILVSEI